MISPLKLSIVVLFVVLCSVYANPFDGNHNARNRRQLLHGVFDKIHSTAHHVGEKLKQGVGKTPVISPVVNTGVNAAHGAFQQIGGIFGQKKHAGEHHHNEHGHNPHHHNGQLGSRDEDAINYSGGNFDLRDDEIRK